MFQTKSEVADSHAGSRRIMQLLLQDTNESSCLASEREEYGRMLTATSGVPALVSLLAMLQHVTGADSALFCCRPAGLPLFAVSSLRSSLPLAPRMTAFESCEARLLRRETYSRGEELD